MTKDIFSGFLAILLATGCFTALPALAAEDAYPSRPVKFILAGQPGGGTDLQARAVAAEMFKAIGQPVIIENRASGNGFIAAEQVARAAPDGYTALMTNNSHLANKFLFKSIPYNPILDFKSVTLLKKVSPQLLDVPTSAEAGMPTFQFGTWSMVLLPAQTPDPIAEKLNAIIRAALRTDSVKQSFLLGNSEAFGNSRAELDQFMAAELIKWGDAIRKAGIPPE